MGNKEASDLHGSINFVTSLNVKFYEYAQKNKNFFINDINYLSADYGLSKWADPFVWHMYKYILDLNAIPQFSLNLANIIKSLLGKNKKAFVLDLDNTLWGGVVGDDGVEGIEIGHETSMGQVFSEFQKYLLDHKQLGVMLNVCSKNGQAIRQHKPKLIVLDCVFSYLDTAYLSDDHLHYVTDLLSYPEKFELVNEIVPEDQRSNYLFELAVYHNRFSSLNKADFFTENNCDYGAKVHSWEGAFDANYDVITE